VIRWPEHSDWCEHLLEIGRTLLNPAHEPCLDALSCVAPPEEDEEYAF
jgi:hypothetical protein